MRIRASLALLLAATGCSTTYKVPKAEISRLDGWFVPDLVKRRPEDANDAAPAEVRMRDTEGREHTFTEDTPLVLVQRDGAVIAEKFLEVNVDGQYFRGVPQDAFRRNVEIPLSEVKSAGVREFHLGKTLLLCGGIAAGVAAALVGAVMATSVEPTKRPSDGNPCGDIGCEY